MKNRFFFFLLFLPLILCKVSAAEISKEWTVYGPYYRLMHRLPDGLEKSIPAKLKVGSQTRPAVKASPVNGKLDIAELLGKQLPRRAYYVSIPIESVKGEKLKVGAGADWWMDLYLNGQPVGDTLMDGNGVWPPSGSDHIFTLNLKPGKNLLVIGVIGGAGTQQLFFQPSPDESRRVVAQKVFGKEKLPPFSAIGKSWKMLPGKPDSNPMNCRSETLC